MERCFCVYGLYSLRHPWCADKEVLNIYSVDEILKCDHLKLIKPLSRSVGLFITLYIVLFKCVYAKNILRFDCETNESN